MLARPNSIITYGAFQSDFEYDYLNDATVTIYQLADGASAQTSVYDKEANKLMDLTAERAGNTITVTYTKTTQTFRIAVAGTDKCVTADGSGSVTITL